MNALPKGWVSPTIEEIGIAKTKSVNPALTPTEHFELWSVPSFPSDEPEILTGGEIKSNKAAVQPNDVLLCKINPRINRVWIVRPAKKELPQIASSEWIVVRNEKIDSHYLRYAFIEDSFRIKLCLNVSGVGGSLTRARPQDVKKYRINIAPPKEQKRIVKKLDTCQGHIDRSKTALDAIPQLLENYRASLLSKAFSGELTADWRAQQKAQGIQHESAEELLQRLRQERRQQWEQSELEKYKAKGKIPPKGWKDKYKEALPASTKIKFTKPNGWLSASLNLVSIGLQNGVYFPKSAYGAGIQILRVDDYQKGWTRSHDLLQLVNASPKEIQTYSLQANDILINRVNSPTHLGKCRVIKPNNLPSLFESNIMRLKLSSSISVEYVEFYLNCQLGKSLLTENAKWAVNQASINQDDVLNTSLLLPTIAEQKEIVTRLESAFIRIDAIKDLHSQLSTQHTELTQSLLAKAFRGELVPQEN